MLSSQSLESLPCLHNKVRHQILASSLLRYIQNLAPSCDLWCHHLYPCHCLLTWTTAAGSWLASWLILLPLVGPLVFFSLFRILESHSHFINGKMKVLSINCVIWLFSASLIPFPTFSPHLLCFSTLASLPFLEPVIRNYCRPFAFPFAGNVSHIDMSGFCALIPFRFMFKFSLTGETTLTLALIPPCSIYYMLFHGLLPDWSGSSTKTGAALLLLTFICAVPWIVPCT